MVQASVPAVLATLLTVEKMSSPSANAYLHADARAVVDGLVVWWNAE